MSSPGTAAYVDLFRDDAAPVGWQRDLRAAAIGRFATLGFPTTRHEDWRYTNLKTLTQTTFAPVSADVEPDAALLSAAGTLDAYRLVFVNGRFAAGHSDLDGLPAGVSLHPVARLLEETPDALAAHLAQVAPYDNQPLTALNTALFNDGAALRVDAGVEVERPIHLVFVSQGDATASYPRILITLQSNSRATVLESHVGSGTYLSNVVTEIELGDGARLDLAKLSREADGAHHVATTHARQGRDSQLHYAGLLLGSKLTRNALHVRLGGTGAHCQISSLNLGRDRQHVDSPTVVDHAVPHCTSNQLVKSILDGHASCVFDGKVIVRQGADKTDAVQQNRNLLLAKTAVANTRPQLEIYADDVKCSHGATVGQLDETALFYLRSRGLDLDAARAMLTYSFGLEVVERIEKKTTRDLLRSAARTWLRADAAIEAQT